MENTSRGWGIGAAFVLGLGLIVAASIVSYAFYSVHTLGNTLSVTGSATTDVKADAAKWTVNVSRTAFESTIPTVQSRVSLDTQGVVDFLRGAGIDSEKILASAVFVDKNYKNDQNAPDTYNVHEDISVQSDNPELIQRLSKDISRLSSKGILFSVQAPQYYVTTLPKIRVSLIGAAITDAKARALAIASSTGQTVGALESASGGVVQVMAPNSISDDGYGSYDTSTIDKMVMVTAHATFYLK
jgi:hypothetical protein